MVVIVVSLIMEKNKILTMALAVVFGMLLMAGCKEEVQLPEQDESQYNQLYMPLAVNNPVENTLTVSESEQQLVYGANFGGRGYPEENIPVGFSVDPARVADFNEANGTSYELLPAEAYTLGTAETNIPAGKLATEPLSLSVKTAGEGAVAMFKTYLLPLSIQSSFKINEALQKPYYIITAEPAIAAYPDYYI